MSVTPAAASAREQSAPLTALLQELVRAKLRLSLLCAYWLTRSPALEADIALANIAQEELGHAQVLEALLHDDFGLPTLPRDAAVTWNAWPSTGAAVDIVPQEWPAAVVEQLLLDGRITSVLHALAHARGMRLAERARKMIQEEQFHELFVLETLRSLAAVGPAVRTRLQALVPEKSADLARELDFDSILTAVDTAGLFHPEWRAARAAYAAALAARIQAALADDDHAR